MILETQNNLSYYFSLFKISQLEYPPSEASYIKIEPFYVSNVISHIIVETEKEVPDIISAILKLPTLFGYQQPEEKKQLLVSKVTSFERIEKDY